MALIPGTRVGSASNYIPQFAFLLEWPEDISDRRHNQFAKQAMRVTLEKYHASKTGFRRHFTREGRRLYDYQPRKVQYEQWKQKKYGNGSIDMVKTGRTRQWMQSAYRLTVGGTAANRSLNGTLKLTFPFKGGSGRFRKAQSRGAITITRLILEMQRFADDEPRQLAADFHAEYMRQVDEFRRGRKRIRIRS